jgi:hypothetical protein
LRAADQDSIGIQARGLPSDLCALNAFGKFGQGSMPDLSPRPNLIEVFCMKRAFIVWAILAMAPEFLPAQRLDDLNI